MNFHCSCSMGENIRGKYPCIITSQDTTVILPGCIVANSPHTVPKDVESVDHTNFHVGQQTSM